MGLQRYASDLANPALDPPDWQGRTPERHGLQTSRAATGVSRSLKLGGAWTRISSRAQRRTGAGDLASGSGVINEKPATASPGESNSRAVGAQG